MTVTLPGTHIGTFQAILLRKPSNNPTSRDAERLSVDQRWQAEAVTWFSRCRGLGTWSLRFRGLIVLGVWGFAALRFRGFGGQGVEARG